MRTVILVCLAISVMLYGIPGAADAPDVQATLSRPVAETNVQAKSLPEAAFMLLRGSGVPVAVERIGTYVCVTSQEWTEKPVSLHLAVGASVAAGLDAAVEQDLRYEWKVIGCWVHIMPRARNADYILDQPFLRPIPEGVRPAEALGQVMDWFPEGWDQGGRVLGSPKPVARPDCGPVPDKPTIREAIDIGLWRSGVSFWEARAKTGGKLVAVLAIWF
jgi:hypothetical protein